MKYTPVTLPKRAQSYNCYGSHVVHGTNSNKFTVVSNLRATYCDSVHHTQYALRPITLNRRKDKT